MKVIYRGSVKDIYEISASELVFKFSDRYSVFDWGEMPDHLEGKGRALAQITSLFFNQFSKSSFWQNIQVDASLQHVLREFQEHGLKNHFICAVDKNGHEKLIAQEFEAIKVKKVNVLRPPYIDGENCYNYSSYKSDLLNSLVPLEMIFRFSLTEGSSIFDRINDAGYLNSLNLKKEQLEKNKLFLSPILEFSTKLESRDRYLNYNEAKSICGFSHSQFKKMLDTISVISSGVRYIWQSIGVELVDGKIEMGMNKRENQLDLFLVDSIGPDELRLKYNGQELSKECLRTFYRKDSWFSAQKEAKKQADLRKTRDWKSICHELYPQGPMKLPAELKIAVEMLYRSLAKNLYLTFDNVDIDPSAWTMEKLSKELGRLSQ